MVRKSQREKGAVEEMGLGNKLRQQKKVPSSLEERGKENVPGGGAGTGTVCSIERPVRGLTFIENRTALSPDRLLIQFPVTCSGCGLDPQ